VISGGRIAQRCAFALVVDAWSRVSDLGSANETLADGSIIEEHDITAQSEGAAEAA
jgi:hypothetical protein